MSGETLSFAGQGEAVDLVAVPVLHLSVTGGALSGPIGRFPITGVGGVRLARGSTTEYRRVVDSGAWLDISLHDAWMSSAHARILFRDSQWLLEDLGSKNGTFLNGRRVAEAKALGDGAIIEVGSSHFVWRLHELRSDELQDTVCRSDEAPEGLSLHHARTLKQADAIAASDVPVILGGESGVGKEVLARRIHESSGRRGRFLGINSGAVSANLAESILFGHCKGAFSGATDDSPGVFVGADGGTLLLDEVAELSADIQVKLLRVLQESEVLAIGATQPQPVDVRLIAASHANLDELVEEGRLRRDLYMRMAGLSLEVASLRDRLEDLGALIVSICRRRGKEVPGLSREVLRLLFSYAWPGNIRELEQVLITALELTANGEPLSLEHFPQRMKEGGANGDDSLRDRLETLLRQHRGNVSAVARDLGKARVQVRRWCKRLELDIESFR